MVAMTTSSPEQNSQQRFDQQPDHQPSHQPSHQPGALADRRGFLRIGGVTVLGLVAAACADASSPSASPSTPQAPPSDPSSSSQSPPDITEGTTDANAAAATTAETSQTTAAEATVAETAQQPFTIAAFEGLGTCSLMPEKTAGPFPLDQQFDRRDVTEGYPGQPMRLGLRVLDESCAAVPGATVEIWHADATGDYSAFADNGDGKDEGAGTTFLRGTQTADDDGIVEFLTVYPGWYSGRAVHIHLRVHLADATVLTSQMFFDSDYTAGVYAAAPYDEFGLPDTSNEADGIAGDAKGEGTLLHTSAGDTSKGAGTVALLNLAIDASAS
jgi:protocatechuate 3,4-dioxygenase beta subunit